MKLNKNTFGFSIIEIVTITLIVSLSLLGVYKLIQSGRHLTILTENRLVALNLAREGVEAVINYRDTNWVKYDSYKPECWLSEDYDNSCVLADNNLASGTYILARWPSGSGNHWRFVEPSDTSLDYAHVELGTGGWTYQDEWLDTTDNPTICTRKVTELCRTRFRRIIELTYATSGVGNDFGISDCWDSSVPRAMCVKVDSIVRWYDTTSTDEHEVVVSQIVTNWDVD